MRKHTFLAVLALTSLLPVRPARLSAQTKVDLGRQSSNVDFRTADSTRPVKTGTTLPPTCGLGELFFNTAAPQGSNLYSCAATNTWSLQRGAVSVENNGVAVGSQPVTNYLSAAGMVTAIGDTGSKVNIQQMLDTAVVQTKAAAQAGGTLLCSSSSGSGSAYACSMNPVLGAYTAGMVLQWKPDVDGTGGPTTLNVDTLGAKAVKLADGLADPTSADLVAGRLYAIWYDGSGFRVQTTALLAGTAATRPTCNTTQRGRIWQALGGAGAKDEVTVCAKDAADLYDWRLIY